MSKTQTLFHFAAEDEDTLLMKRGKTWESFRPTQQPKHSHTVLLKQEFFKT